MQETQGRSPGWGHGNALQYSCLKNHMTEQTVRLHSMGSQRIGPNWACTCCLCTHTQTQANTISVYYDTFPRMETKHLEKGVCFLICSQVSRDEWLTLPSSTASVIFPGSTPHAPYGRILVFVLCSCSGLEGSARTCTVGFISGRFLTGSCLLGSWPQNNSYQCLLLPQLRSSAAK